MAECSKDALRQTKKMLFVHVVLTVVFSPVIILLLRMVLGMKEAPDHSPVTLGLHHWLQVLQMFPNFHLGL